MSHDSALAPLRDELDARRAEIHKMAAAIEAVTTLLDAAASNGFAARVERVTGSRLRIAIDLAAGPDETVVSELSCAGVDLIPMPAKIDAAALNAFAEARDESGRSAPTFDGSSRPEPAPRQAKPNAAAKEKPKAWTTDEDDKAVRMYRDGATVPDIAAAVGRPVPGTTFRLRKLRDRLNLPKRTPRPKSAPPAVAAAPPAKASAPVSTAAAPAPAEPVKPDAPGKSPDMRGLSIAQRAVAVRLADLPFSGWTLNDDLDLVEAIVRGAKVDAVAAELERGRSDCLARWRLLCPKPGPEAQADLMAVLRRRVADARAGA